MAGPEGVKLEVDDSGLFRCLHIFFFVVVVLVKVD